MDGASDYIPGEVYQVKAKTAARGISTSGG